MSEQPIPLTDTERERDALARAMFVADCAETVEQSRDAASAWDEAMALDAAFPVIARFRALADVAFADRAERDRRVRAAALAPIQALADEYEREATGDGPVDAMQRVVAQELRKAHALALAAAGVDAAEKGETDA